MYLIYAGLSRKQERDSFVRDSFVVIEQGGMALN